MNNKWELFNQIVSQHKMDKEENVQRIFEQLFAELFGYSRLFGEIDAHRVLHIGSTDRVIPDIIIRDSLSNKDLFIVELKQLNLHYDKKYEEQLMTLADAIIDQDLYKEFVCSFFQEIFLFFRNQD